MIVVNSLVHKLPTDLIPGELFTTDVGGGYALCIHLRDLGEQRSLIAILEGEALGATKMAYEASRLHRPCLSFGSGWVLELLPGKETFPQNAYAHDAEAAIFIDGAALVLRLADWGSSMRRGHATINMATFGDHELSPSAAPIRRWRIWRNGEDRITPGAKEIFSFP